MDTVNTNRRTKKSKRSPRKRRRAEREANNGKLSEVRARLNHLRMAPRKVRLVADLIRGKEVDNALLLLEFSGRLAARPMLNLLKSAVANAKNEDERRDEGNLYIHNVWVDEGKTLHRFRPRAMGRASRIRKKMSHITIVLKERE